MKFGKYLQRRQVSAWKKKYVFYKLFKKQIKAIKRAKTEEELYIGNESTQNQTELLLSSIPINKSSSKIPPPIQKQQQQEQQIEIPLQIIATSSTSSSNANNTIDSKNIINSSGSSVKNNNPLNQSSISTIQRGSIPIIIRENNVEREEKKFDSMLQEEFDKVNTFFQQQEDEFIHQFNDIKQKVLAMSEICSNGSSKTLKDAIINGEDSPRFSKFSHLFYHPSIVKKRNSTNLSSSAIKDDGGVGGATTNSQRHTSSPSSSSSPSAIAVKAIAHAANAETYWNPGSLKLGKIRRSLKRAMEENYREIQALKEYTSLNLIAFRKIFKKYDKVLQSDRSVDGMKLVQQQYFVKSKKLVIIEREIESLYTNTFKHGNRRNAMAKLRVPKEYNAPPKVVFLTGGLSGMSLVLFIFCVRYMINNVAIIYFDSLTPLHFLSMFMLHRMIGIPILLLWYFGILLYVTSGKNINLFLILGWDARTNITHYHILFLASGLTFLWTLSLFLYTYLAIHIDGKLPILFPFLLIVIVLFIVFCPFNIIFRPSRYWLIHTFARIFSAPFLPVKFKDFFFGDQFTSLSIVLSDLEYVICFFVSDLWTDGDVCWRINPYVKPCLVCVPPLLRALQSLRRFKDTKQNIHMMNFGKYSLTILSTVTSSIANSKLLNSDTPEKKGTLALWIVVSVVSTIYSLGWDFLMDWGVLRTHSRNFLLRDHLFYRHKWVYYFAMITNTMMRGSWTINVSFEALSSRTKELIVLATAVIEVTRRFQWNFFRLENEHLSNVGKFRAFDLKIPDILNTQSQQTQPTQEQQHENSTNTLPGNIVEPIVGDPNTVITSDDFINGTSKQEGTIDLDRVQIYSKKDSEDEIQEEILTNNNDSKNNNSNNGECTPFSENSFYNEHDHSSDENSHE
ncbi:hypothetical protein RB653_000521 [Dictyostelium firmibasis]|uniref:Uncharacterized protein n=1 Tax=Dictyostelium firmibasis TaxID=79012 RepID=A0AAN7YUE6_9MYCE